MTKVRIRKVLKSQLDDMRALCESTLIIAFGMSLFFNPSVGLSGECSTKRIRISGSSMAPLLSSGSFWRGTFGPFDKCLKPIRRDDIILYTSPKSNGPLIKRVVAVPGDGFGFNKTQLMINGNLAVNADCKPFSFTGSRKEMLEIYIDDDAGQIPADAYLVLREQSGGSKDSTRVGPEKIIGRLIPMPPFEWSK